MNCSSKLFRNLWLADGTGAPLRRAAVLVRRGLVQAVEPEILGSAAAEEHHDLGGRILAPGFLDAHGHSDLSILASPEGFGRISQGVTGEIVGNCGLSAFPLTGENRDHLTELYRNYGVELDWEDFAGWQKALNARNVRLRMHALCGHNTLRAAVAGYEKKTLSGTEFDRMKELLETALQQGASGLSTGLLYVPGKFADRDELLFLMKLLARAGSLYATHLRSEGRELLESLEETIELARSAGLRRVHISHFKTAGRANWHKLDRAIALLEEARAGGMELTVDRYPYTESMTQLSTILPGEWEDLDDETIERRLADPATAETLEHELAEARPADSWPTVRLVGTSAPGMAEFCGETFDRIATRCKLPPAAVAVRLLAADAAGTTAGFRGMSEENLRRIIALDYCACGSDENARPADGSLGSCHPRAFGSLPHFLRLRLDASSSIEAAVRQVTGLPAGIFRLADAGVIAPGKPADLSAFDPETIDGQADFLHPHAPASGILFTLIGGEFVYRGGSGC